MRDSSNQGSDQFLNWSQEHATGMFHSDRFESILNPMLKKPQPHKRSGIFWQRMRDSNPRKRSQSPVCYRYTNPLYIKHGYHYIQRWEKVKHFFPFLRHFFVRTKQVCPDTVKLCICIFVSIIICDQTDHIFLCLG